jgi:hypothetical protein
MYTSQTTFTTKLKYAAFLFGFTLSFLLFPSLALAQQFGGPIAPYGDPSLQPSQFAPQPPPIGSGSMPEPVVPGDLGPALPPASDPTDQTTGSIFPTTVGQDRTVVHVYVNGRMVQTLRPDQFTDPQIQQINGILGINMLSGQQTIDVEASSSQIAQIQEVLMAWPQGYQLIRGYKKIVTDQPGIGYPKPGRQNGWDFFGPLPTVRVCCRYLVILACVVATIWLAQESIQVMLGFPMAGMRVFQTFAGLFVMFSAFTVWKIAQMNLNNAISNTPPIANDHTQTAPVSNQYYQVPDVPGIPQVTNSGPPRAGLPVMPYGEPQNP